MKSKHIAEGADSGKEKERLLEEEKDGLKPMKGISPLCYDKTQTGKTLVV